MGNFIHSTQHHPPTPPIVSNSPLLAVGVCLAQALDVRLICLVSHATQINEGHMLRLLELQGFIQLGVEISVEDKRLPTYPTPPKTNMEPENGPLQKEIPLETILFRFHLSFQGCISQ